MEVPISYAIYPAVDFNTDFYVSSTLQMLQIQFNLKDIKQK
jgi:hypothetical protein